MAKARDEKLYGTGHEDGLEPLSPLDPGATDSVDALVRGPGVELTPILAWNNLTFERIVPWARRQPTL